MTFCHAINLLTFSEKTMAENNLDHINFRRYFGRELARIGDVTNNRAAQNNWTFEQIMEITGCASFGLTTGLAVFWVCQFVHSKFIKNE
jgi:hypothetical protein